MADSDTKTKIRDEMQRIEEDCTYSGKAQFNAGDRWARWNLYLGIPSAILGGLAGIAFFKSHGEIATVMSILSAVLTTLNTFLKPSERASAHKSAGDQYLALRNDARIFRTIRIDHACDDQAAVETMDEYTKRRNELNQASAPVANKDFTKARKGIEEGEADHKIDQETK